MNEHFANGTALLGSMNDFDRLIKELNAYERVRNDRRALHAQATGTNQVGMQFRKAMGDLIATAAEMLPKRRPTIILKGAPAEDTGAELVAKALRLLDGSELNPMQRGTLMLKLSELHEAAGETLAKAQPAPTNDQLQPHDETIASIKRLEDALDRASSESHRREANRLLAEAEQGLNSGRMRREEHVLMRDRLSSLRQKIEEGHHA
jgi:hypothetical protein